MTFTALTQELLTKTSMSYELVAKEAYDAGITTLNANKSALKKAVENPEFLNPSALRALLTVLPYDRDQVEELVDPVMLLNALWDTNVGKVFGAHVKDFGTNKLADLSGLSTASFRRWEKATHVPSLTLLTQVLEIMKIDATELSRVATWPPRATGNMRYGGLFPSFLRMVRADLGCPQHEFAEKLGFSQGAVSSWSTGATFISESLMGKLAGSLTDLGYNVTVADLKRLKPLSDADHEQVIVDPESLGDVLRNARLNAHMSYAYVCDQLYSNQYSHSTIKQWENNEALPSAKFWPKLIELYGLDIDVVFEYLIAHDPDSFKTKVQTYANLKGMTYRGFCEKLNRHPFVVARGLDGTYSLRKVYAQQFARVLKVKQDVVLTWAKDGNIKVVA